MRILRDGVLPIVIICENDADVTWLREMARCARNYKGGITAEEPSAVEFEQYDSFKCKLDSET
jgi:hypothetical protein